MSGGKWDRLTPLSHLGSVPGLNSHRNELFLDPLAFSM